MSSPDTLFNVKGLANDHMYEIISKQGDYQIKFDLETGEYISPKSKNRKHKSQLPSGFATFVTHTITLKATTV